MTRTSLKTTNRLDKKANQWANGLKFKMPYKG